MICTYLALLDAPEEQRKFEQLYNLHKNIMLYVAKGILRDHQLAEDAVHEAFIRIIKNFSKIGETDCPPTRYFAVIIVRNVSLTMLAKRRKLTIVDDPDELAGDLPELEDGLFARWEYQAAVAAIRELPVIYRDVLFLQYVEEFRLTEIAELLGLDREVVKKRAQRGKKKLLALLEEKGHGGLENGGRGGLPPGVR